MEKDEESSGYFRSLFPATSAVEALLKFIIKDKSDFFSDVFLNNVCDHGYLRYFKAHCDG